MSCTVSAVRTASSFGYMFIFGSSLYFRLRDEEHSGFQTNLRQFRKHRQFLSINTKYILGVTIGDGKHSSSQSGIPPDKGHHSFKKRIVEPCKSCNPGSLKPQFKIDSLENTLPLQRSYLLDPKPCILCNDKGYNEFEAPQFVDCTSCNGQGHFTIPEPPPIFPLINDPFRYKKY
jgi:hypothetical protein